MRTFSRALTTFALTTALAAPLLMGGCAARVGYRTYDPYYNDYHTWDSNEVGFYTQWETNTHREHKDFRKRSADEQKEYWTYRHSQK
ncbi:MAG TPA: hypothetical protein VNV41_07850 [Candidatus Acidoferrales bacterium]|jgi:hypothetical protein|nr:hypothetical protein [Candidatus Acidoferrales bacterium]